MSMKVTKYSTPLRAGTAAAVAIAAPTASAADQQSCNGSGSRTVCSLPATFRSRPPAPGSVSPYGDQALLLFHH